MSTDDDKQTQGVNRRAFFRAGGGAAVVAAASMATGAEPALAAETDADRKKARYRESDHVKTFYRVNRY